MENREPQVVPPPPVADAGGRLTRAGRVGLQAGAFLLLAVGTLAAMGFAYLLKAPPSAPASTTPTAKAPDKLQIPNRYFVGWDKDKPDLVIVVTAQQHGYVLPCGCSRPQVGGLERRANLLKLLHERGWPVLAVDVGDIAQKTGPAGLFNLQGPLKYKYSMRALQGMGYTAVGLGEYDVANDLTDIAQFVLNEPTPKVLAANIKGGFPGVDSFTVVEPKGSKLKVGVAGAIGASVTDTKIKDPNVKFDKVADVLPKVTADLDKHKPDLRVLIYQGSDTAAMEKNGPAEAVACARSFPQFQVVACLSDSDTASFDAKEIKHAKTKQESRVVSVGHKGKTVGVLGVWRTGKADEPFTFKYDAVELTEAFLTPEKDQDTHPVSRLMEQYTAELKAGKFLEKYGQTKHPFQVQFPDLQFEYKGSKACRDCHPSAYKKWEGTGHSHAYETLENAHRPGNRQYDAECIVCHTVGFAQVSGFPGKNEGMFERLKGVGCESCHGPGSAHMQDPENAKLRAAMNPWRTPTTENLQQRKDRITRSDAFCSKCHDDENDVNWKVVDGKTGFEQRWGGIAHPTPEHERQNLRERFPGLLKEAPPPAKTPAASPIPNRRP